MNFICHQNTVMYNVARLMQSTQIYPYRMAHVFDVFMCECGTCKIACLFACLLDCLAVRLFVSFLNSQLDYFCTGLQIWKLFSRLFIDSRQCKFMKMVNMKRSFEIIRFVVYGLGVVEGLLKIIKFCTYT